ncbi:DUF397 domain-containing protein [Streptomyces syringium]|uniref:DUF397 domain-containing protein n=1 Tax=Streptomyces syringium TaxID=76729 RepID=UPI00345219EF
MGDQIIRPIWLRSSFSGPTTENCVEVAFVGRDVWVRDSHCPDQPSLSFSRHTWRAFLTELEPPKG